MSEIMQKFEEEMKTFEEYVKEMNDFLISYCMNEYRKMIVFKKYD
jgi:hypothetical protein